MQVTLYGIPNCNTVKKARDWLQQKGIDYVFHDFRKQGINKTLVQGWSSKVDWQTLLNRRGTTWRKLAIKNADKLGKADAIKIMCQHSSVVKRPVLVKGSRVWVGFDADIYNTIFATVKK
ncbi:MAG: ArsC family reductase [Gammaproteobacteria bacterium]|nr:MAG: ArsC family reductase [Gammaproteobacteria bacterium]